MIPPSSSINDILVSDSDDNNNHHCYTLHSGGSKGADTIWEEYAMKYGILVKAYSYKTDYHKGINKVEISDSEYIEGCQKIKQANKILKRYNIDKYMNLLSRNWLQVKNSQELFAVGYIVEPNEKFGKYYNKSIYQEVGGGTGYTVKMNMLENKQTYIFNLRDNKWYKWSFSSSKYIVCTSYIPMLSKLSKDINFAGIGTRDINEYGIQAIREFFENNFKQL